MTSVNPPASKEASPEEDMEAGSGKSDAGSGNPNESNPEGNENNHSEEIQSGSGDTEERQSGSASRQLTAEVPAENNDEVSGAIDWGPEGWTNDGGETAQNPLPPPSPVLVPSTPMQIPSAAAVEDEWTPPKEAADVAKFFEGRNGDRQYKYVPGKLYSQFHKIPADNLRRKIGDSYDRVRSLEKVMDTFPEQSDMSATHEKQWKDCLTSNIKSTLKKLEQLVVRRGEGLERTERIRRPAHPGYSAAQRTEMLRILNHILSIGNVMKEAEKRRHSVDKEREYPSLLRDALYNWILLYENMNALRKVAPRGPHYSYDRRGGMLYEFLQEGHMYEIRIRRNMHAHNYLTPYIMPQTAQDEKPELEAVPNRTFSAYFDPGVWDEIATRICPIIVMAQQLWYSVAEDVYLTILGELAEARDLDAGVVVDEVALTVVTKAPLASVAEASTLVVTPRTIVADPGNSIRARMDALRLTSQTREDENWDRIDGQLKKLLDSYPLLATKEDLKLLATKEDVESLSKHVKADYSNFSETLGLVKSALEKEAHRTETDTAS